MGVVAALWIVAAALAACAALPSTSALRTSLLMLAPLVSGGFAIWAMVISPQGLLAWDGEAWAWSVAGLRRLAVVKVTMDFGSWVLVRIGDQNGFSHWVWMTATSCPDAWQDFRRALVFAQNARNEVGSASPRAPTVDAPLEGRMP